MEMPRKSFSSLALRIHRPTPAPFVHLRYTFPCVVVDMDII